MSALSDHWKQIIKERLVELAMTKGLGDDLTKRIAQQDIDTFNDILEITRRDAWQEGHDAALMHGQSENPHFNMEKFNDR